MFLNLQLFLKKSKSSLLIYSLVKLKIDEKMLASQDYIINNLATYYINIICLMTVGDVSTFICEDELIS